MFYRYLLIQFVLHCIMVVTSKVYLYNNYYFLYMNDIIYFYNNQFVWLKSFMTNLCNVNSEYKLAKNLM